MDLSYNYNYDLLKGAKDLITGLFTFLKETDTQERFSGWAAQLHEDYAQKPLGELVTQITGMAGNDVVTFLNRFISSLVIKTDIVDRMVTQLINLVDGFLKKKQDTTIIEILKLDSEQLDHLNRFITDYVIQVLSQRLPDLLQSININELVVNKVDSLDIERVEGLLLIVIARHLKYINIFGAFLGAIIGFMQVVINQFM